MAYDGAVVLSRRLIEESFSLSLVGNACSVIKMDAGAAALLGTVGNLLIIGTLVTDQRSRNVGNLFIINLAASDMIVTALINPFALLGVIRGKDFYADKPWLCEALANLCISSCVCSLFSIGCISVNRYIYVCHNAAYRSAFTRRRCALICFGTWLAGILFDLPSHVGWSRHGFDRKTHKCLWDRTFAYSYTVFFVACGILVPLLIITAFYLKIFIYIGAAKKRLDLYSGDPLRRTLSSTLSKARMMFVIFLSFACCWTPYSFVLLFDRHDTYRLEVHLYASLAAHLHASLNFVIYGVTNARIRKGYGSFVRERLLCRSRAAGEPAFCSDPAHDQLRLAGPKRYYPSAARRRNKPNRRRRRSRTPAKTLALTSDDVGLASYSNELQCYHSISGAGLAFHGFPLHQKDDTVVRIIESEI
ncbi:hypothetical protein LSH36_587g01004 [Paralvinella palmiformis]|uniref:G-protein coupled receptors family 1 profile domain-containing protein n=1 Tax=Paralvinella palmiformis TaxID=53620 RepID=A0AAD9J5W3_9ANNE|nr:hypothetical protein LSH36_587g01004 [Paralvinella palmiformis]